MHSPEINLLAEALSKAQAEISGAHKDSTNPHFKSKYADLESVWDACRAPLTKNGLSVLQSIHMVEKDLILRSTLVHTSGQYYFSEIPILMNRNDMQGMGSAITYARRYGLSALVGVCPSDDDANMAVGHPPQRQEPPKKAPPAPRPPQPAPTFYQQIIGLFKTITNNYQDKACLDSLVAKYGKSEEISKLPPEKQEVILGELKMIHQDNSRAESEAQ